MANNNNFDMKIENDYLELKIDNKGSINSDVSNEIIEIAKLLARVLVDQHIKSIIN